MADSTGSGSNGGTTTVVANPPNPPTTNTVPNTTTDTKTVQYQTAISDPHGLLAAEDAQLAAEAAARSDAEAFDHLSTTPGKLNDPLAGLTPAQLKSLGGADPTDPYIRARLGIPQLPGSILNVTGGFGFGNLTTNLPSIDNALGTIKSLFGGVLGGGTGGGGGLSSLFTNFASTVGGLFGGTPTASTTAATTGSGTAALVAPVNTFTAQDTAGILAAEDAQLAAEAAAQGDAEAFGKLSVPRDPNGVLAAEDAQLAAEAAAQGDAEAFDRLAVAPTGAVDPFEAARLEAAAAAAGPTEADVAVDPLTDDELAVQDAFQQDQRNQLAAEYTKDAEGNPAVIADEDAALYDQLANRADRNAAINTDQVSALVAQEQGSQESAIKARAQKQATIQARYKQPGNTDWRVRLSLAPNANYLYNAENPGILAPLRAGSGTDGVIFPYTPSITTSYSANYEQYDLTHSNYRGLFYKNSRVGDIQIRGTFTAQNTTEANYLLAVIHFFRSATKMFYGQDPQRGTPPPVCLLNGFGGYQFSDHPVVISSFNYTLPNDVDYIRTTNPNNFGLSLANRYNPAGASLPAGGSLSGINRLVNALLPKGAQPQTPAPNSVAGSVTNNTPASYVPTKMEIDITLIPAQTRAQISKQFSLAGFANGDLLKGGFW
jgi:hypothetical protein